MIVQRVSPISGKTNSLDLDITEEQIRKYESGAKIQDAFPHLSADDREFILTGITKEEWDQMSLDIED